MPGATGIAAFVEMQQQHSLHPNASCGPTEDIHDESVPAVWLQLVVTKERTMVLGRAAIAEVDKIDDQSGVQTRHLTYGRGTTAGC